MSNSRPLPFGMLSATNFIRSLNAFLTCSEPARLQELADHLTARDIERCAQKVAAGLHAVLHADGATNRELSASTLLRAS
jgi:hypothetical protein